MKTIMSSKKEEETKIKYKKFLEIIETDKKGNRIAHLIDYSKIIRISLILIEVKETNNSSSKPLQKEDLSLQLE